MDDIDVSVCRYMKQMRTVVYERVTEYVICVPITCVKLTLLTYLCLHYVDWVAS